MPILIAGYTGTPQSITTVSDIWLAGSDCLIQTITDCLIQTITTVGSIDVTWGDWSQLYYPTAAGPAQRPFTGPTEQQHGREERLASELAALEATNERMASELAPLEAANAKKRMAAVRAGDLLKCMLAKDQRAQYERERAFEVLTGRSGVTRRYRLRLGRAGNVFLIDAAGREVEKYCIHPDEDVPNEDNLVAQKLLLEADEAEFLRIANRSVPGPGGIWISGVAAPVAPVEAGMAA